MGKLIGIENLTKEIKMAKCLKCGNTDSVIYSGVDAFCLGVTLQVEKICYTCASRNENKDVVEVGGDNGL
jgi:hypothetical protein